MTERARGEIAYRAACLSLVWMLAGCGSGGAPASPEEEALLTPVSFSASYETAARRTIYNAKVYQALVCPRVEEYGLEQAMAFEAYDVFPGDEVEAGDELLHGNTGNIDKRIEAMEKSIDTMVEDYRAFQEDMAEALGKAGYDLKYYGEIMEELEDHRQEPYLITVNAKGETVQVSNPGYPDWAARYGRYEALYRKSLQTDLELEESYRQRTELYELDLQYNLRQLEYLRQDRDGLTLVAGMGGVAVAQQDLTMDDWVGSGKALMAVGAVEEPELKCDYVDRYTISRAQDVYCIIDGKRYEVEYVPMDSDEYRRLEGKNGKVYSTFRVNGGEEIRMGSYAVIVVIEEKKEDVLTVSKDAVRRESGVNYVYVLKDSETVYTPVRVGLSDGLYREILSGLEEGDRVMTDTALSASGETAVLERGSVSVAYKELGYLYYPSSTWVYNPVEYGTAYFVEGFAMVNQRVEQGELLARIRVVPNEVELERNLKRLQREMERLAVLKAQEEEENQAETEAREKTVRELTETIEKLQADFSVSEIRAPVSGIIMDMASPEKEDLLPAGAKLFLIADESASYVWAADESAQLTYGNSAVVAYRTPDGQEGSVEGTVVTMNRIAVSRELDAKRVLIRVSPEDLGSLAGSIVGQYEGWWVRNSFQVTADARRMDNVLLVPKRAVRFSGGDTYVKVIGENGEASYQSFVAGGSDISYYWVAEGLTEGMKICLE